MLDNLDFKAIKILLNLYNTRNTYVTAEQLDLSQSAVARTLAKCRQSFNEPLFIRSGNQLTPTAFTEALVEKLPGLLNSIEDIVATNTEFDPANITGRQQIFLNRQTQLIYGAKLFEYLHRDAPNATWHIKGWDSTSVDQLMDDRAVFGVNYYNPNLPNSICQDDIAEDVFAIFAPPDHPLHKYDKVTPKDLTNQKFVSISIPNIDEKNVYLDAVLQEMGVKAEVAFQTDNLALGIQVAESQSLLLLTTIYVYNFSGTELQPINFKVDPNFFPHTQHVAVYARKNRTKPILKWLMQVCDEVAEFYPSFEFDEDKNKTL